MFGISREVVPGVGSTMGAKILKYAVLRIGMCDVHRLELKSFRAVDVLT